MLQDIFKKKNIYSLLTQEEYDVVFLFSSFFKKKERNSSICLFLNKKKQKQHKTLKK